MSTRHPLAISLTPELAELVAVQVASGLYGSVSEVVRAGLRLLVEQHGLSVAASTHTGDAPRNVGARAVRKAMKHD